MAAVIGDFGPASRSSPFCNRGATATAAAAAVAPHHDQHHHHHHHHYADAAPRAAFAREAPPPRSASHPSPPLSASSSFAHKPGASASAAADAADAVAAVADTANGRALRVVLTPPEYASPVLAADDAGTGTGTDADADDSDAAAAAAASTPRARDGASGPMAPPDDAADPALPPVAAASASAPSGAPSSSFASSASSDPFSASFASSSSSSSSAPSSTSTTSSAADTVVPTPTATRPPPPTNAIPSPVSEDDVIVGTTVPAAAATATAPLAAARSPSPPPQEEVRVQKTVLIRDLRHIQALAQRDRAADSGPGLLGNSDTSLQDLKFEISAMPIADVIEMVAALLTRITTANDREHDALSRGHRQQTQHAEVAATTTTSTDLHSSTPLSASVLAFHGKNVPAITILSYLSRIHKYCPTTYEVFLSLLVYFDRMAQQVNDLVAHQQEEHAAQRRGQPAAAAAASPAAASAAAAAAATPDETDEALADSSDDDADADADEPMTDAPPTPPPAATDASSSSTTTGAVSAAPPTFFVVDSYNIHRLIIAGVTCASKFFSDVFYTNSRYAKVGGLPLAELNHLELQFLILNDFRLAIPIEDLEAYATMLVEFYAREVVNARPAPAAAAA